MLTPPTIAADRNDVAFCFGCGYDLRTIDATHCPECGEPCDEASRRISAIPWVHRRRWFSPSAFLRTVAFVIARPHRLAAEAWRPGTLSRRDAMAFRWACVAIAVVSVIAAALASGALAAEADVLLALSIGMHHPRLWFRREEPVDPWIVAAFIAVWLLFFNRAAHVVRAVIVSPNERYPDAARAERTAEYTAAPLVVAPPVMAAGWFSASVWHWIERSNDGSHFPETYFASLLLLFTLWWLNAFRVFRDPLRPRPRRRWMRYFFGVPAGWFVLILFYFYILPTVASVAAAVLSRRFPWYGF